MAVGVVVLLAGVASVWLVTVEIARRAAGDVSEPLEAEYGELLLLLVPFALAAPFAGWAAARWSLRPIDDLANDALQIGAATPSVRLTTDGLPLEVVPTVQAVNGALDRLAVALEAEQRLTADAAHALRTPLAVLDLRFQRALDTGHWDGAVLREDLARLRRLVEQLLTLASAESQCHRGDTVDIARLVREVAASRLPAADEATRTLDVDAPSKLMFRGDRQLLWDAVANLADNALQHGVGAISLAICQEPAEFWISVTDEGCGPAMEQRRDIRRFNPGPASVGTGLGIAIAAAAAKAHGGTLAWTSAATVTLRLPMMDQGHAAL